MVIEHIDGYDVRLSLWNRYPFRSTYIPVAYHPNVRVAERLALPTSDQGVAGSNPAGDEILSEP